MAVGILFPDHSRLASVLLIPFFRREKGSSAAGELPNTRVPSPRPPGRLPAGRPTTPRAHCPQVAVPRRVPGFRFLQADAAIPSQCVQGLTSSSPHPFLFFSSYLLLYFLSFCPTPSLFQTLCTSGVFHGAAQGLERIGQVSPGMGDRDRSFLKGRLWFSIPNELSAADMELPCAPCSKYVSVGERNIEY